jgi:hypothetical protein
MGHGIQTRDLERKCKAMSNQSNSSYPKPNPALKDLEFLVGEWELQGAHPHLPNPVRGRASFEWLEGGAFLAWKTEMGQTGIPSGTTINGWLGSPRRN